MSASVVELLTSGDPRLSPSDRVGDAWALISRIDSIELGNTRLKMRELLESVPRPADRTSLPGHLTGSALVVDSSLSSTLLLLHAKLGIWVQPGGHADGDMNLMSVALREATEETGIDGLRIRPVPIDLDIHEVRPPAEQPHFHHDVRFLVAAPEGAEFVGNHESLDHRWVRIDEVADMDVDPGLRRMAARVARLSADAHEIG